MILAHVVRRGVHCAALPFDLVLDNPFYVEAGVQHYHLPKRLDPTLRIDLSAERITCTGNDVVFGAELGPIRVPVRVDSLGEAALVVEADDHARSLDDDFVHVGAMRSVMNAHAARAAQDFETELAPGHAFARRVTALNLWGLYVHGAAFAVRGKFRTAFAPWRRRAARS